MQSWCGVHLRVQWRCMQAVPYGGCMWQQSCTMLDWWTLHTGPAAACWPYPLVPEDWCTSKLTAEHPCLCHITQFDRYSGPGVPNRSHTWRAGSRRVLDCMRNLWPRCRVNDKPTLATSPPPSLLQHQACHHRSLHLHRLRVHRLLHLPVGGKPKPQGGSLLPLRPRHPLQPGHSKVRELAWACVCSCASCTFLRGIRVLGR